ncbi:MAG: ABC transporter permease [Micromonosporaceae bacterium]
MRRALAAGLWLQLRMIREHRDYSIDLVRTPLLTMMFLLLVTRVGSPDLVVNAVVAAALASLWSMGLSVAGEIIDQDRVLGTLELTVATPAPLPALLIGRILGTLAVSGIAVAEVWLVTVGLFRLSVPVHHLGVFIATVLATAAAMAGTSLLMSTLFVATRTARTFQNSASYPVLLLGGVFVPVDSLPAWTHGPARLVFLSWSSDLLRDSLRAAPVASVGPRLAMVVLLGLAGAAGGLVLLRRVLNRIRLAGTLGLT